MKKKEDELLLYVCLKERINSKKERDDTISRSELNYILGVIFCIPKDHRDKIVAELIEMNMLKFIRKNRQYYYKVLN